jgi:transcription antitermination factor NusG
MQRLLGKMAVEVFIPCLRAEGPHYTKDFYFMEGYTFVRFEGDPARVFKIEADPFFESVVAMPTKKGRLPEPISEKSIQEIRDKVGGMVNPNDIAIGDTVLALDGVCRNMEGTVEAIVRHQATVAFVMYSKTRKEKIPLFCLKRAGEVSTNADDEEEECTELEKADGYRRP